jgi:hypothetical protein
VRLIFDGCPFIGYRFRLMAENELLTTEWERNNNPLGREPWQFVARLGMYQHLGGCLWEYDEAVEILFKAVGEDNKPPNLIARPLLHLMRHALELGYKYTLDEIRKLDGKRFEEGGHNLSRMHQMLGEEWKAARKRHGIDDSGFDEHYGNTEKAMQEFERLDKRGDSFRYPTHLDGKPCFDPLEQVDLLAIKDSFDAGMILLRHTADLIDALDWAGPY